MERPSCASDSTLAESPSSQLSHTAESASGFDVVAPKRNCGSRGGVRRCGKLHKGGVAAPADLYPRRHGADVVDLLRPSGKTQKVSQTTIAAVKIAEKASKAASTKRTGAIFKLRQNFVTRREELMRPVRAFADHVRFLPSIPATATVASHSFGYNNTLVKWHSRAVN